MASMSQEEKRSFMLTTPVNRLIPLMALPTIAAMLVTSAYNLADTFFVSKLGTLATSAVGVNGSIDNIIMMAGTLLATGASSFASRLLGAKEDKHADQVLSTCFYLSLVLGLLVLALGSLFTDPLLRLLGANEEILPYSRQYARYILLAAPFMATSFVTNQCLRAEGNAVYSMVGMIAGAVLNIALDPLFIFTFHWGVAGASAATAISKVVSWVILIYPYLRGKTMLHIRVQDIRLSWRDTKEVCGVGSAAFFRNALSTVSAILLNRIAVGYGAAALAAISITHRFTMFISSACMGFGMGFQPVVGFSWGAGRYDRVQESFRFTCYACIIGISVIAVAVAVFSKSIILLFTVDDQELIRIGSFSLLTQSLAMPVFGLGVVVNMLCAGLGKAKGSLLLGLARQGICFLPILPVMVKLFGVWGVASVQAAADFLAMFLLVPIARKIMREVAQLRAAQDAAAAPAESL